MVNEYKEANTPFEEGGVEGESMEYWSNGVVEWWSDGKEQNRKDGKIQEQRLKQKKK